MEEIGIEVLHNEAVALSGADEEESLYLVGVAPLLPGVAEPPMPWPTYPMVHHAWW